MGLCLFEPVTVWVHARDNSTLSQTGVFVAFRASVFHYWNGVKVVVAGVVTILIVICGFYEPGNTSQGMNRDAQDHYQKSVNQKSFKLFAFDVYHSITSVIGACSIIPE